MLLRGFIISRDCFQLIRTKEDALAHDFASLEFHRSPGRDRYIDIGLVGISADTGAGEPDFKNTEIAQLHILPLGQRIGDMIERPLDDIEDIALNKSGFIADGNDQIAFGEVGHS